MAVYLWNWYTEVDGNGRVSVSGVYKGQIQKETVKKLAGIFAQGMLLETVKGHRIALEYAGALDTRIPSYAAVKFPEYRCNMETEKAIGLNLEADYCRGRLRTDSPLLFYLFCWLAWEPERWEEQGRPFFLRRVYWKNAQGMVSDETKEVEREESEPLPLIYYSNKDSKTGKSTKENKPPNVYFAYGFCSKPIDFLYIVGQWHDCTPGFLRVGNVGKEPLGVFGKEKVPGYVIQPGRQYAMDGEKIKFCESIPWRMVRNYL